MFDMDVSDDAQTRLAFDAEAALARADGLVHSIGFAPREAIAGDTSMDFRARVLSPTTSGLSFPALARLPPLMEVVAPQC
jgi:enoyl-[acyl-carrier protein] reductase I